MLRRICSNEIFGTWKISHLKGQNFMSSEQLSLKLRKLNFPRRFLSNISSSRIPFGISFQNDSGSACTNRMIIQLICESTIVGSREIQALGKIRELEHKFNLTGRDSTIYSSLQDKLAVICEKFTTRSRSPIPKLKMECCCLTPRRNLSWSRSGIKAFSGFVW